MNRDDIIRMAREAGIRLSKDVWPWEGEAEEALERFAALVAAAEREACARACESAKAWELESQYQGDIYAAAIRARGE